MTDAETYDAMHTARGFDIHYGADTIRSRFPYLSTDIVGGVHARRCGFIDAIGLGNQMLSKLRDAGAVNMVRGSVIGVDVSETTAPSVRGVRVASTRGDGAIFEIATPNFVNATGPYLRQTQRLLPSRLEPPLPVFNQLHAKVRLVAQ